MKLLVIILALVGVVFGQFNKYNPQPRFKPTYRQTGQEKYAEALKHNFDLGNNGAYQYEYETENGITAQQNGYGKSLGGIPPVIAETVQGAFSWRSPEGKFVSIGYTADENGYRPFGDAIPTPPPIPDYILRSIEYIKSKSAQKPNRFF